MLKLLILPVPGLLALGLVLLNVWHLLALLAERIPR